MVWLLIVVVLIFVLSKLPDCPCSVGNTFINARKLTSTRPPKPRGIKE